MIRKQWLIFYPLALAVINTMAFLAVYAASSETLRWSDFFAANFERWQYVRDYFFTGLSFTPALGVAVFAGFAVSAFAAMIRAPYFRAIAGLGYPLAPRNPVEAGGLFLFYLFANLVVWVMPMAIPASTVLEQLVAVVALVVAVLIVFADYAIVFEGRTFLPALRRSVQLLSRRWVTVVVIFVVLQLVYLGLHRLYDLYYQKATGVFILLPLSQILVEALIVLFVDLVLIFLYEQIRRQGPV
ncbi:MAG: hypothetical protein V1912_12065 [bacterium]